MNRTKIDWADFTWNPVVGCRGVCPYCYARRMARRFHMGRSDFLPEWSERNFNRSFPRKPSRIFVNSMSDISDWEPIWQSRVDMRIRQHPEHRFLALSKNPEFIPATWWEIENLLCGASVTDQRSYDRLISRTPPRNFLSIEPILGPVKPWGIHKWIIVGAETGNRKGRVKPKKAWLEEIWLYSRVNRIPLFFKDSLRIIWPSCLLSQEYPA
ncbi:MAG: DUF5131 family protein [Spirochaetes bacterium]|nr:DUF5131 family protein [Spirochaetota bacterium]